MSRHAFLLVPLAVAAVVATTVAPVAAVEPGPSPVAAATGAASEPSYQAGDKGFYSVLGYGSGQTVNATELAQYEASGTPPSSFVNQEQLYNHVITKQPSSDAQLTKYFKNSDFSVPTGNDVGSTETIDGATVIRDKTYAVPHIYASNRSSAMYADGYVQAQDRLFLMDVLRHTAEGTTAELLGPDAAAGDSAQLGQFDLSPQELTKEVNDLKHDGKQGKQAFADFKSYVAGINDYIDATKTDPSLLPAEYPALGITPKKWTMADSAATAYYLIAQFTVAGDGEEKQSDILDRLQRRLGPQEGRVVYGDLRNLANPDTPVTASKRFDSDRTGPINPKANARIDPGSITPRDAIVSTSGSASPAASPAWARQMARTGLQLPDIESNATLVAGSHTKGGHPAAAMGPQVDYYSPEIFDEIEIHAPGIQVSGVVFPGADPYPLIGHGKNFAWTGTTALGDNADTFAEKLCNPNGSKPTDASSHYVYNGRCRAFTHRTIVEHTPVAPTSPSAPQTITEQTERSVHGPIFGFARAGKQPVALARATAVYHHGIHSILAFERLAENHANTPTQFIHDMRKYTGNENWFYISSHHIAYFSSGMFQRHAKGTNLELPIWGTGKWDWKGFNPKTYDFKPQPKSFNPRSIDPKQGYLTSWNNDAARGWRATPGTWSFGRIQRVELLRDPVVKAIRHHRKLSLAQVAAIPGNASTQDLRAVKVLPEMLQVLGHLKGKRDGTLVKDLKAWHQTGSHRRSTTGKSYYDHSPAVLFFDSWWRTTVHAIYNPIIGTGIERLLYKDEDMVLDQRPTTSGFFDGWQSQLSSVLRKVEGIKDPANPKGTYCGTGTLESCRRVLQRAFAKSVQYLVKTHGKSVQKWQVPVLCSTTKPTCDENIPTTAGAVATPAQPFENRGTFHQVVQIRR